MKKNQICKFLPMYYYQEVCQTVHLAKRNAEMFL